MKKIIVALTFSASMLLSLSVLAQNDSSSTSPSIKVVADSSYNANDTIKIGDMLIIKKQGNQYNSNSNNSYYGGRRNWNSYNNRKRNRLYGTSLNITNGKIAKDTFFSANGDSVQIGSLLIVTHQEA